MTRKFIIFLLTTYIILYLRRCFSSSTKRHTAWDFRSYIKN